MRFLIKFSLFISFGFQFLIVKAQHPYFYNLNSENGLPSNEIYNLKQDSFGYVWIGCDAGLFRYDGFSYKKYKNQQQNGRGISFLQFDKNNRIWCKNFFGQIYRVDNDSLKIVYGINTSNPSAPLFTLEDNKLWVINKDSVFKIDDNGNTIYAEKIPQQINKDIIIDIKYFNKTLHLITKNLTIYTLNKNGTYNSLASQIKTFNSYRNFKYSTKNKQLYILCEYGNSVPKYDIFYIDNDTLKPHQQNNFSINNHRIYSIFCNKNDIWLTTPTGAINFDTPETNKQIKLFEDQKISSMMIDREGMLWFSSLHNGIFIIPTIDIVNLNPSNSPLNENHISVIKRINNNLLLLGSYNGNLYDLSSKNEINSIYANKKETFFNVKTIYENENYTIISRGRLCIIDKKNNLQYFPKYSNIRDLEIVNDTAYLVFPNFITKIWIEDLIKNKLNKATIINNIGGKSVSYNKTDQTLYFSLANGTYQLKPNGNWIEVLSKKGRIKSSSITTKNDVTWVSSITDGVYSLKENTIINHLSTNNLLLENEVRLTFASENYLWITTENYLHRINLNDNKVDVFDASIGINPKDINCIETWNDELVLATNNGLIFLPEKFNSSSNISPSIEIEKILLNNKSIPFNKQISLDYNNANLRIYLNSISFKSRGNYNYSYKIEGLDNNFTLIPASNKFIHFSHLPSGKYTIQIKAINSSNIESKLISIPVFISEPYWQTWWFLIIIIIIISVLFTLTFIIRVKIIKRNANNKTKLIKSQLTAIKSQMNPHFLFNTLNSLQDLIIKQDIKMSNYYLSKFSSLLRKVLETSSKNEISLKEEIEILSAYLELEKLRFGSDFSYNINIDKNIDVDDLKIHPMLIQPFIENAIKHGLLHKKGEKILSINVELTNGVTCIIDDNGVGRKKSAEIKNRNTQQHQSFATQASEKRIELLNSIGTKKYSFNIIDKENETGTKVIVKIPYDL